MHSVVALFEVRSIYCGRSLLKMFAFIEIGSKKLK